MPKSNYAFKPIAEQALRSIQTVVPQRLNAALGLSDMNIAILYIEGVDPRLFTEIEASIESSGEALRLEARPIEILAAVEWYIMPAIALYIAKPFVDKFLDRASDDATDFWYPKFKRALTGLVKRLYREDRAQFQVIASGAKKISSSGALVFGVVSETKHGVRLKFVFEDWEDIESYDSAVEGMLVNLEKINLLELPEAENSARESARKYRREIVLVFNPETKLWETPEHRAELP